jgi:hypothetical protein
MIEQETKALPSEVDWEAILDSPEYFLDAIDLQNESCRFFKNTREINYRSYFLEGRTAR